MGKDSRHERVQTHLALNDASTYVMWSEILTRVMVGRLTHQKLLNRSTFGGLSAASMDVADAKILSYRNLSPRVKDASVSHTYLRS